MPEALLKSAEPVIAEKHVGFRTYNPNSNNPLAQPCFLGESVSVSRFDQQKHAFFEKQTERQLSFFWRPEEVALGKDARDFAQLKEHEKHIFLSNLKYQTLLDSVQGRSPNLAFLPLVSLPELETWIETWSFSETIHSRSYTYIMRGALPDAGAVLDSINLIPEITERAQSVTSDYDLLIDMAGLYNTNGGYGHWPTKDGLVDCTEYAMKRQLVRTLLSVYCLEAIRFYVSFACSFHFGQQGVMEGNAKIIKLIARDENLHKATVKELIRIMSREDDPVMQQVFRELFEGGEALEMIMEVYAQEEAWIEYLFQYGSMTGLNATMLRNYLRFIVNRACHGLYMKQPFDDNQKSPLEWMKDWIAADNVQVAPQETEKDDYLTAALDNTGDMSDLSFDDL